MSTSPKLDAEYFDGWYADMVGSSAKDRIVQRHLGLPPHLQSTSLLGWDGLAEVVDALQLRPGQTLLDLACGRGGYGMEVAHRTGAHLIGVDFSAEAVRQATQQAAQLGREAAFQVGDLAATGLPDTSVDALMCVDAIQFADDLAAVHQALRRVLVPGGRLVLTCWEPVDRDVPGLSERMLRVDLGPGLVRAGFVDVEVQDKPAWRAQERGMWEEAAALDPGEDAALQSFHDEGVRAIETFALLRRVLVTALAPS